MNRTTSLSFLAGVLAFAGFHASLENRPVPAPGDRVATADPVQRATSRQAVFLQPPPTEHWMGEGAEARNKTARKAWMAELHRAPPDVDYKTVERVNGLAQIHKRNQLALAPRDGVARDGSWSERGSSNQAGRMHVALHSPDQATLWAGSSLGGIWRRPVGSVSSAWVSVGDNLYGGAHHLLVLDGGAGPDILLAATDGGLIHRSTNDGVTWVEPSGLPGRWGVRRLIATGSGVFALVMEANWEGYSLWRSQDNGASFALVRDLGDYWGDVWSPRTGSDDLYLLDAGEVWSSTDDGDTWTSVGAVGTSEGGELTGSEAGAPTLYAVLHASEDVALWRSDDAGVGWTEKHDVTDYWGTLNASILNADLFAWGGVEVHRTDDGGDTFDLVNGWGEYYGDVENKLHADIPGLDVVLDDQGAEVWYISTDGGLFDSSDGLGTVSNLSLDGLRISQYYSTLTSTANPDHIAAGAQDQGYQVSYVADPGLVPFDQLLSGDYGHLTSGDGTHAIVYSCYPGFVLVQIGEDNPQLGYVDFPDGEEQAWMPPLTADPENREAFFFAATHLYYFTRTPNADEWTPQQWSGQDFSATDGEYISAIEFSPLDPDRAFLSTNRGRVFYSSDKGVNWAQSVNDGPEAHYFYGHAMVASQEDVDTVYLGGSGYDGPGVWRTTDGGETWDDWGQGLPATQVYSLAEADDGSGEMFAGTETAAYQRAADGEAWEDITLADAPVTNYWSAEALPGQSTVRFGTFGRGIWDYAFETLDPCLPDQDEDEDGYPCDVDCDDSDFAVYPGAPEECDGFDVDCDPAVPDEADVDGDGYFACGDDCDDAKAYVHPGADETCDGEDENCDGVIDDDPVDTVPFHPDADGDGHGAATGVVMACEAPDGFVESVDDCDDTDAEIHPDAEEVCGDGRDNDCADGDRACPADVVDEGSGCQDCESQIAQTEGGGALLLLFVAAAARRRSRR